MKTDVLHTRVAPKLKSEAESVFDQLGISSSDAIRIFLKQVVLHQGLPFAVSLPNKETIDTLEKSERDIDVTTFATPDEAFAAWDNL